MALIAFQYRGWDPDKAVADYYGRIRDREQTYETITETNWPFIRIFDVSDRRISGKHADLRQVGEKIMVNVSLCPHCRNPADLLRRTSEDTCRSDVPVCTLYKTNAGQSRIVFFLMNIHNRFRMIYFARVRHLFDHD